MSLIVFPSEPQERIGAAASSSVGWYSLKKFLGGDITSICQAVVYGHRSISTFALTNRLYESGSTRSPTLKRLMRGLRGSTWPRLPSRRLEQGTPPKASCADASPFPS